MSDNHGDLNIIPKNMKKTHYPPPKYLLSGQIYYFLPDKLSHTC